MSRELSCNLPSVSAHSFQKTVVRGIGVLQSKAASETVITSGSCKTSQCEPGDVALRLWIRPFSWLHGQAGRSEAVCPACGALPCREQHASCQLTSMSTTECFYKMNNMCFSFGSSWYEHIYFWLVFNHIFRFLNVYGFHSLMSKKHPAWERIVPMVLGLQIHKYRSEKFFIGIISFEQGCTCKFISW